MALERFSINKAIAGKRNGETRKKSLSECLRSAIELSVSSLLCRSAAIVLLANAVLCLRNVS